MKQIDRIEEMKWAEKKGKKLHRIFETVARQTMCNQHTKTVVDGHQSVKKLSYKI